jgi:hypothetical protein
MKRKIKAIAIMLALVVNIFPYQYNLRAEESSGLSDFDNTLEDLADYGEIANTYLEKTSTGYQTVLAADDIYILDYDKKWNQVSERKLSYELPIFGGYYAGENYNYIAFGQSGSSKGTEIYRIVKYDKDFNRISAVSIRYEECYTSTPFYEGTSSMAEYGNELTLYTSRLRPDESQSNISICIYTDTMTVKDNSGMLSDSDIEVSKSFGEIVRYDDGEPVYVDLGTENPRGVYLQNQGKCILMMDVPGTRIGNVGITNMDTTLADVSGLEVTDSGYIVVGTEAKNILYNRLYLAFVGKDGDTASVTWLTNDGDYGYSSPCNAKIIKVDTSTYVVMWNTYDHGGKVNYVMVDAQGNPKSSLKTLLGAQLTQCEPILDNGKVTWVNYTGGEMSVYSLTDLSCTGEYDLSFGFVSAVDPWDGTADTSWYSDKKQKFTLSKPEQLAGLAELVNAGNTFKGKTVTLGADMFFNEDNVYKLEWTPIASMSSGISFEGTFDGQGHTLYNLYENEYGNKGVALFGSIGENGIVKALYISQNRMLGAAIAYENYGWIMFCENSGLIEGASGVGYTAGICVENYNTVYGCGNSGTVYGDDAGGIVGHNLSNNALVASCWNLGCLMGTGSYQGGIVGWNSGGVYDCYNAGTVFAYNLLMETTASYMSGIAGKQSDYGVVSNCYFAGYMTKKYNENGVSTTSIGGEQENVYSIPSTHNSTAEVISASDLKKESAVTKLQGEKIITKWCTDKDNLNDGMIIPIAQQDMHDGVYKMLADVWNPVTEVSISIADKGYQLEPYQYAYFGIKQCEPVYSSESDVLSITSDGVITPLSTGSATVHVTFEETEHTKECGFDVTVNITRVRGDVNDDSKTNISDLMLVLNHVSGKKTLTGTAFDIADVTGDGKVDLQDLMKILNYVSGKSVEL